MRLSEVRSSAGPPPTVNGCSRECGSGDGLLLDDSHGVLRVAQHRVCIDNFIDGTAQVFATATFLYAAFCAVADFGTQATPYHAIISVLCLVLLAWTRFGEWALSDSRPLGGRPTEVYAFLVGQWWLCVTLMWAGLADYTQTRRAFEFIETNWFLLQAQVLIPFTTQLDAKKSIVMHCQQLMALSVVTSLLMLPVAGTAVRALGGVVRLMQLRLSLWLVEGVPLLVAAGATAGYAIAAAELADFATPHSTAALLFLAASAAITFIVVLLCLFASFTLGASFFSHGFAAAALPLPAFIMLVTSCVVLTHANEVDGWVSSRWESLRLYVPPQYAAGPWKTYAEAAATPMRQAGSLGLLLAVLASFSAGYHWWAAKVSYYVGTQLYIARAAAERRWGQLIAIACGAAPLPGANPTLEDVLPPGSPLTRLAPAPVGYGTVSGGFSSSRGRSRGLLPVDGFAEPSEASALLLGSVEAGGSSAAGGSGGGSAAPAVVDGEAAPQSPAEELQRRLAAVAELQVFNATYAGRLKQLAQDAVSPLALPVFLRTLSHDLLQEWGSHRFCFLAVIAYCAVAFGALSGVLAKVATDGACSALITGSLVTFNFTREVPLYGWNTGGGFPLPLVDGRNEPLTITLVNNYPLGSVEVINGELSYDAGNDLIGGNLARVEVIYFGVSRDDLPSNATAFAAVVASEFYEDPGGGSMGGYYKLSVVLNPPIEAAEKCLGARLRVTVALPAVQFNITSPTAAVTVKGSISGLAAQVLAPSVYALYVATSAAPVTVCDLWADSRFLSMPTVTTPYLSPSILVATGSGAIFLDSLFSAGLRASSATGNVRLNSVASACVSAPAACGIVEASAGGSGTVVFTQLLMGYGVKAATDSGTLAMINVAALVGDLVSLDSVAGAVYLTNLLQGAGNETRVTTRGKVSVSATFVNKLTINALESSAVSLAVVFAGINLESTLTFAFNANDDPLVLPLRDLFTPKLAVGTNYSLPEVAVTSNWGDITALSVGGNPASPVFANIMSLNFYSVDGAIKIEVSGGGINANYSVSSGVGRAEVEIEGMSSSLNGFLGTEGDSSGKNFINATPSLTSAVPRAFSAVTAGASFKLPDLPYDYGALEPAISGEIMRIHHTKHHNAYVTNLNVALEKYAKASASGNVSEMIALQPALRFNGGGHVNHSIFWQNLAPAGKGGGGEPTGKLAAMITAKWGNFAAFKAAMNAGGVGVQGSGWVWLGVSKATKELAIVTCANQDPISTLGLEPLLGIDVWEHAYYLQYKNMRADYLTSIWNVVNWGDANRRLESALL